MDCKWIANGQMNVQTGTNLAASTTLTWSRGVTRVTRGHQDSARHSRWWVPVSMDPKSHCDQCGKRPSHEHHSKPQSPGASSGFFRWKADSMLTAASLLVLIVKSHSLVFMRPRNSKTSSENHRPMTDYIEKVPHERNRLTTMSHSIDPLRFRRRKMKPSLASFVTERLNIGFCNASSSARL